MSLTVEELAGQYHEAWATHDVDAIVALHTEDSVVHFHGVADPSTGGVTIRQTLATLLGLVPDLHFEAKRAYFGIDHIVFEYDMSGTVGESLFVCDGVDVIAVRDGLVARKDTYLDLLARTPSRPSPPTRHGRLSSRNTSKHTRRFCDTLTMGAPPSVDVRTEALASLLGEAHDGRIQVPEFQRRLVLEDDESVKSLLASVSLGYPIGVVSLLQAGNPDVRFTAFPIDGVPLSSSEPERLLIDGQHRVTTLYRVLASGQAVQTRDVHGVTLGRWYYIDIREALDPDADRDEAIVSVPETRRVGLEMEWERCLFPLRLIFGDETERARRQRGFAEARSALMDRFAAEVLRAFDEYLVLTIVVGQGWARWSVRVHGGPDGRTLSDRFRVVDG